jgi:hypothetical protein
MSKIYQKNSKNNVIPGFKILSLTNLLCLIMHINYGHIISNLI